MFFVFVVFKFCTRLYNSIRYQRFFNIFKFMCKFNIKLQLKFLIKHFNCWIQKLFNCKNLKKNYTNCWILSTIASFILSYLLNFDLSNEEMMYLLLHMLTYNLIRYQRIFNIIESMCKFIIELQLKLSIKQFDC